MEKQIAETSPQEEQILTSNSTKLTFSLPLLAIISLLALLVGLVGGYLVGAGKGQNQIQKLNPATTVKNQEQTEMEDHPQNEFANKKEPLYKEHIDEKLGLSFLYPSSMRVLDETDESDNSTTLTIFETSNQPAGPCLTKFEMQLGVKPITAEKSYTFLTNMKIGSSGCDYENPQVCKAQTYNRIENTLVGQTEAATFINNWEGTTRLVMWTNSTSSYVYKSQMHYCESEIDPEKIKIFNQILSSFQFFN